MATKKAAKRKAAAPRKALRTRVDPLGTSVNAREALEAFDGPLTLGSLLNAIRVGEEWSLADMAKKLAVPRSNVWEVEQGKRSISPALAAKWAQLLGRSSSVFVELALQAELDAAGIKLRVQVKAA